MNRNPVFQITATFALSTRVQSIQSGAFYRGITGKRREIKILQSGSLKERVNKLNASPAKQLVRRRTLLNKLAFEAFHFGPKDGTFSLQTGTPKFPSELHRSLLEQAETDNPGTFLPC